MSKKVETFNAKDKVKIFISKEKTESSISKDIAECFICKEESQGLCPSCEKVPFCCEDHLAFHLPSSSEKCNPFVIKKSDYVGRWDIFEKG